MPPAMLEAAPTPPPVTAAIMAGAQKYTNLNAVPILAIYAVPHDMGPLTPTDAAARAAREAQELELAGVQANVA
jgi:hypothetical protein